MTTEMRLPTNMDPAGTVKRPTARSMTSACRTVKFICTPMEMLSTTAELHSGRMRSTVLKSSTCCTVQMRHGRTARPSAPSTSPSVIAAARFRKLHANEQMQSCRSVWKSVSLSVSCRAFSCSTDTPYTSKCRGRTSDRHLSFYYLTVLSHYLRFITLVLNLSENSCIYF